MVAKNGLIDGQQPGSQNEYYVALGLDRLKLDYIYQYQIFGGRLTRGGQVLDFLVLKPPKAVPVYVGAEGFWHKGRHAVEDLLKKAEVIAAYPGWELPVDITEEESETAEKAFEAVKEKIGP